MSYHSGRSELDDFQVASKMDDPKWVELHVPRFATARPRYQAYERFLGDVLKAFCKKAAPLAIIQARAKGVPSFAEKILRKRAVYMAADNPLPPDPLLRLTDLCGGRVIAQTSEQVKAVCALIEQCFDIDWENSDDASTRLKTTEFGYRTINYIVMANPDKLTAAHIDVPIPPEILAPTRPESPEPLRLKAEIQVRTLLEHAYSDIGHDLTYKTEVKVPDRIQRSFSAVAAILETTDKQFERLINNLSEFRSNYGAYHTRPQVKDEIRRLSIVLRFDKDNVAQAVRIANLAIGIGDYEQAIQVLDACRDSTDPSVQQTLGSALTHFYWDSPKSADFAKGCGLLKAACTSEEATAERLCTFAECLAHCGRDDEAGKFFKKALSTDAAEPRSLCRYLEWQVRFTRNETVLHLAEPMIRNALARCALQIEGRVNLPNAWSCKAFLNLLIGEPFKSLDALAHLLALCERPQDSQPQHCCAAGRAVSRLSEMLEHLQCIKEKVNGFDWLQRAVLLGLASRIGDADALDRVLAMATPVSGGSVFRSDDRVVILAGGCADEVEPFMPALLEALKEAVAGQTFVLISGGTAKGVSGVADALATQSPNSIRAIGYLPDQIRKTLEAVKQTGHYDRLFSSPGAEFTPLDPLQGWTDLIASGVDPSRVKVIGYACGSISRFECAWALALGAKVGLVTNPELPKERQFDAPAWASHPHLLPLPLDAMTLYAFLRIVAVELSDEDKARLEPAARMAHEDYVKSATPKDPSLKPWEELDEPLKLSNYHQVAFWEKVLKDVGLHVRKLTEEDQQHEPLDITQVLDPKTIVRLAQLEHGRWNVERLSMNWHYAKEKDVTKRLSPYLIAWDQLTPGIQKYDVDAIVGLPHKLRHAELELERS